MYVNKKATKQYSLLVMRKILSKYSCVLAVTCKAHYVLSWVCLSCLCVCLIKSCKQDFSKNHLMDLHKIYNGHLLHTYIMCTVFNGCGLSAF